MVCLHCLEKGVHPLITQYPFGKGYPNFYLTVFAVIPLAGAYLYYREYKNPPTNPNKVFLPDPQKTAIKFGDKIVPIVENKREEASFLPKTSPEKLHISTEIVTQVKENVELNTKILESLKLAFQNQFEKAKENLEAFKKDLECTPEEMKEISRKIDMEKQFIDQLEIISHWSSLYIGRFEPFNDSSYSKDFVTLAYDAWINAIGKAENNKNLASFFSLLEIGLSKKGWLDVSIDNDDFYESMFEEMRDEVNQRLEKTWMCHLMNRVYKAVGSARQIDMAQDSIEIPENAKPDEALSYLCRLAKYFHRLGNHDELLKATFEQIFYIVGRNPIEIEKCTNAFTLILSCFTDQQLEGRRWVLQKMKQSIQGNGQEASPEKIIQLLLVIQNDYKTLGDFATSDEILDRIIELIDTLPQEEKKPWVEKAAIALNQLQLYEKADLLVTKHNASIEEVTDRTPLMQSIFLGALALSTVFVRPFYPLCACVIVPLIPTLRNHIWQPG